MAGPRLMAAIDLRDDMSNKLTRTSQNLTRFEQQVNGTSRSLSTLERAAEGAMQKIGQLAAGGIIGALGLAAAKITGMGVALYGLGKQALGVNMSFEKMTMTLGVMFKDGNRAKEAFNWMLDFAQKTPFEVKDLTSAIIQLEARKLDYKRWLPLAGDLASGAGVDMNYVLRTIGWLKGGNFGVALENLRAFGITSENLEEQGLKFNKRTNELQTRDPDKVLDALEKVIKDRFPNLMEKQAATVEGIMSNIKDAMTRAQLRIFGFDEKAMKWKDGSLYDMARQAAKAIKDFTDELIDLPAISDQTMPLFDRLGQVWKFIDTKLRAWYEGGGREKIEQIAGNIGETLANNMLRLFGINVGESTSILSEIGHTAGKSFWEGFKKAIKPQEIFQSDLAKGVATAAAYFVGNKLGGPRMGTVLAGGTALYSGYEGDAMNGNPASGWNLATLGTIGALGYFATRGRVNPARLGKLGRFIPGFMRTAEEAIEHAPAVSRAATTAAEVATDGLRTVNGTRIFTMAEQVPKGSRGLILPDGVVKQVATEGGDLAKVAVQATRVAEASSAWAKFAKGAKGGLLFDVALSAVDIALSEDKGKAVGRSVASTALGAIGAGIGTVIGGPIGTLVGGWAGNMAGAWVGEHVVDRWRKNQEARAQNEAMHKVVTDAVVKYGGTGNDYVAPYARLPGIDDSPKKLGFRTGADKLEAEAFLRNLTFEQDQSSVRVMPKDLMPTVEPVASNFTPEVMPVELAPDVTKALLTLPDEFRRIATQRQAPTAVTIPKLADQIVVREEADIDRITSELATKLRLELSNMGQLGLAEQ